MSDMNHHSKQTRNLQGYRQNMGYLHNMIIWCKSWEVNLMQDIFLYAVSWFYFFLLFNYNKYSYCLFYLYSFCTICSQSTHLFLQYIHILHHFSVTLQIALSFWPVKHICGLHKVNYILVGTACLKAKISFWPPYLYYCSWWIETVWCDLRALSLIVVYNSLNTWAANYTVPLKCITSPWSLRRRLNIQADCQLTWSWLPLCCWYG